MGRFAMYRRRGTSQTDFGFVLIGDTPSAGDFLVNFLFDAVISTAPANWDPFTINANGPLSVSSGGGPGDNFVILEFSEEVSGEDWAVNAVPTGLTFLGGRVLLVPQSGTVDA